MKLIIWTFFNRCVDAMPYSHVLCFRYYNLCAIHACFVYLPHLAPLTLIWLYFSLCGEFFLVDYKRACSVKESYWTGQWKGLAQRISFTYCWNFSQHYRSISMILSVRVRMWWNVGAIQAYAIVHNLGTTTKCFLQSMFYCLVQSLCDWNPCDFVKN